jgi:hypothetical protein
MVQLAPGTACTWYNWHLVQLAPGTTGTWYNWHLEQLAPGTTGTWLVQLKSKPGLCAIELFTDVIVAIS